MQSTLPQELRSLVRNSVALLGDVIRRELGEGAFFRIEALRKKMALLREVSDERAYQILAEALSELKDLSPEERSGISHSFSLMLELMNACEGAFRTFRLRERPSPELVRAASGPQAIIYVLTAHPTEARSPRNIFVFHQIQQVLTEMLRSGFAKHRGALFHLLAIAWRLSIPRSRKPSVQDEAEHVYSVALRPENLAALLEFSANTASVYLRSWVGGDKDGHPGVNEATFQKSLQISRNYLLPYLQRQLEEARDSLELIKAEDLRAECAEILSALPSLRMVQSGDGKRVLKVRASLRAFGSRYERELGSLHPSLVQSKQLLHVFPALVLPLELRESSDMILEAVGGKPAAIRKMLRKLGRLSEGADPKWYARGLIISMASSIEHVQAACTLAKKELGAVKIPVIPLFEQKEALDRAGQIVRQMIEDPKISQARNRYWSGYLEVMLGYSDSAKEMGVLPSRLAVSECVRHLDKVCARHRVAPIFFHGSGGSIDRGGGSVSEQMAWWPKSAMRIYKATIQGEMVERSFASPEIELSGFGRIVESSRSPKGVHLKPEIRVALDAFAERIRREYQAKVSSPEFLEVVQCATAYRYLSELRLGSRPAKRGKVTSVSALRAIPWVLCWTQTRVLFPTWWGVGTAWKDASSAERKKLQRAFCEDPLFGSYVKALGFTLSKVEMPVWRIYLEQSGLEPEFVRQVYQEFSTECRLAVSFVREVTGEKALMWYRTWLAESVKLRSSMIHPLNLLQVIAMKEEDDPTLIRETVTGIASGMMTTG